MSHKLQPWWKGRTLFTSGHGLKNQGLITSSRVDGAKIYFTAREELEFLNEPTTMPNGTIVYPESGTGTIKGSGLVI